MILGSGGGERREGEEVGDLKEQGGNMGKETGDLQGKMGGKEEGAEGKTRDFRGRKSGILRTVVRGEGLKGGSCEYGCIWRVGGNVLTWGEGCGTVMRMGD